MVHGRATHPAAAGIGCVGALLVDGGRGGSRVAHLVPAHAGVAVFASARDDGVVEHERLVIAEVAICQAVHDAITDGVQPNGGALLGHTTGVEAEAGRAVEGRHAPVDGGAEGGV